MSHTYFICVFQWLVLWVLSPHGPSSHQPMRQPWLPKRGAVRRDRTRPPLPVSPRLRGRALWDACFSQLCEPRVVPAASLWPPLAGDQHQPAGAALWPSINSSVTPQCLFCLTVIVVLTFSHWKKLKKEHLAVKQPYFFLHHYCLFLTCNCHI